MIRLMLTPVVVWKFDRFARSVSHLLRVSTVFHLPTIHPRACPKRVVFGV